MVRKRGCTIPDLIERRQWKAFGLKAGYVFGLTLPMMRTVFEALPQTALAALVPAGTHAIAPLLPFSLLMYQRQIPCGPGTVTGRLPATRRCCTRVRYVSAPPGLETPPGRPPRQ